MSTPTIELGRRKIVPLGLVVAVGLLAAVAGFRGPLSYLVGQWTHQDEYSHGFLIPIVAALLLWVRRDALQASIGHSSWTGPALTLIALIMLVVGQAAAIFIISEFGFILALIGLVLGIGGYSLLKAAAMPVLFLVFAVPLPHFLESMMSLRLQLISTELGAFFIRLFQIPVYLDGNIIDLGYYKIQVVDACSGLRYIWPLMSLTFLAAYLFNAPFWQRTVVFLSSIPVTIVMNSLRIGLLGVTMHFWGSEAANEVLHFFEGWIVFLACTAILALEIHIFARLSGRTIFDVVDIPRGGVDRVHRTTTVPRLQMPLFACLLFVFASILAASWLSGRSELIPDRPRFVAFPERIGQWRGHNFLLDPDTERLLKLDDYLLSDYTRSDGQGVNFYVGYYASQRTSEQPHSPNDCIPGSGWRISKFERTNVVDRGSILPVNRAVIEKNSVHQLVYYWFDEGGTKVANEYLAKLYFHLNAVSMNRSDGSLIRLVTRISTGESERDADLRLKTFIHDVMPVLSNFLLSQPTSE